MVWNSGHKTRLAWRSSLTMVLWLLASGSTATAADKNNVHLYGALVAEPCVIPPGQEEIRLDFGTVVDSDLYLSRRTLGQPFELHLAECDLSIGKTVKATFQGIESSALPGLLAIDGGSQAKGIAIGLETKGGESLPLNKPSRQYELQAGGNIIGLRAYIQGEAKAIENKTIERGAFTAIATFKLDYE